MPGKAILIAVTGWNPQAWYESLRDAAPGRDVRVWPMRMGDPLEIAYACAWKPAPGLLLRFPNLKVIFSLGAGVDHLIGDPLLPQVPVVRIVDPDLTMRMTEYVTLHVLMIHRRQRLYDAQQRQRVWRHLDEPAAKEVTVGVMGLGVLGRNAIDVLARIGFRIAGWSRTPRTVPGVECFHGAGGLDAFLARSEILVCLLPHTPATEGILNRALFQKLRRDGPAGGAHLINAGRGMLQVDDDILASLDDGTLASATLDVFPTEPLPKDSALWSHSKVTISPHNAAVSDSGALVHYVLEQIGRFEQGLPLENVIDRAAGY